MTLSSVCLPATGKAALVRGRVPFADGKLCGAVAQVAMLVWDASAAGMRSAAGGSGAAGALGLGGPTRGRGGVRRFMGSGRGPRDGKGCHSLLTAVL